MTLKRIQVYADDETVRRVELAAAKHNLPVTKYCLQAIAQQLRDDDMLERNRVEIRIRPEMADLLVSLRTLHRRILTRRAGKSIDVDQALAATRDERDDELIGLY